MHIVLHNGHKTAVAVVVVFGRPFVKRFALYYRTVVCLVVALVYCGQIVGWITMKLGMEVGLCPGHILLDGDPAPPASSGHNPRPISGPYLLWPSFILIHPTVWPQYTKVTGRQTVIRQDRQRSDSKTRQS